MKSSDEIQKQISQLKAELKKAKKLEDEAAIRKLAEAVEEAGISVEEARQAINEFAERKAASAAGGAA